jgi:hypothetical protein
MSTKPQLIHKVKHQIVYVCQVCKRDTVTLGDPRCYRCGNHIEWVELAK